MIIQTDQKNMSQIKNSKKLRAELAKFRGRCGFFNNKKPLHAHNTARDHAKNRTKPTLLLGPDESCLKKIKKRSFK